MSHEAFHSIFDSSNRHLIGHGLSFLSKSLGNQCIRATRVLDFNWHKSVRSLPSTSCGSVRRGNSTSELSMT